MASGCFRWFEVVLDHFKMVLGCFSSFLAFVSTSKATNNQKSHGKILGRVLFDKAGVAIRK